MRGYVDVGVSPADDTADRWTLSAAEALNEKDEPLEPLRLIAAALVAIAMELRAARIAKRA